MKKLLVLAGLFLCHSVYAQGVIYKCTSSDGEVTYQNSSGDKSACKKTNFASFPNISFFKHEPLKVSSSSSVASEIFKTSISPNVSNEQRVRDSKRALILGKELAEEREQLKSVSVMLKNLKDTKSTDSAQIAQLEGLSNSHSNNIKAIERELGTKNLAQNSDDANIVSTGIPASFKSTPSMYTSPIHPSARGVSLPTSMPDEFVKHTSYSPSPKFRSIGN